jgi:hypothetical protein
LFLLGHSCWSYLFARLTGRELKMNMPAYLALLSGVLPDFDIYFQPYLQHHTYTHSLLILGPVVAIISYRYKRLGVAFSVGLLSHLLTDSLVGTIPLFYPLYPSLNIGLNLGLPSLADTFLELGALGLVVAYAFQNGDYELVLHSHRRESVLLAIPLVAIVTLTLLFAGDRNIPLVTLAFSRRALTVITIGHVALAGILAAGVLQGVRAYLRKPRAERPQPVRAGERTV